MATHFDLIAIGGGSGGLAVPGAEFGITSDGFFRLTEQPRRVAVIGAGYIGVELAGVMRALGSEVTVVALEAPEVDDSEPKVKDRPSRPPGNSRPGSRPVLAWAMK